jgi:hypothetical protein
MVSRRFGKPEIPASRGTLLPVEPLKHLGLFVREKLHCTPILNGRSVINDDDLETFCR